MMGSFDAGYGTWYREDLVGKKKAEEMWYLNLRLSTKEALEIGLINCVVPDASLREETRKMALELAERGAFALACITAAFPARHSGVVGFVRVSHDLLLRLNFETQEHEELGKAFGERRKLDPDTFCH